MLRRAVEVGEKTAWSAESLPEGFEGPGLAVLFTCGEAGALAVLPAMSGLVPEWAESPDATGESRLSTLAQELGMLLLPETVMADGFEARVVANAAEALAAGEPAADAASLPITVSAGDVAGVLTLVFPLATPGTVLGESSEASADSTEPAAQEAPPEPAAPPLGAPARRGVVDFQDLPVYSRSLLKVPVDVTVCLASKQQSIDEIVHLGPGAIISFEKSCEDPVEVTVGEQTVAKGEVVKVGERFGVRIDTMVLPAERFIGVRPKQG